MSYSARTSSAPAHLLMLDDNRMGLLARKAVMEELGYRVTTVSSPNEAFEHLGRDHFDVVITDYRMPNMSGTEFIQEIRQRDVHSPVVLISGYVDALGLNEKNTGADYVIQKSAHEINHMVRAVKTLLRRAALKKPPSSQQASSKTTRKKA